MKTNLPNLRKLYKITQNYGNFKPYPLCDDFFQEAALTPMPDRPELGCLIPPELREF